MSKQQQQANDNFATMQRAQIDAANEFNRIQREQANRLNKAVEENTGEKGYKKSLEMASRGANITAGQAGQQIQNAYRSAGLSKAQAAQLAGGASNQAYQNQFAQQQGAASGQLGSRVGGQAQTAGTAISGAGQYAGQRGQLAGQAQQEVQNVYNRRWGGLTNTAGAVGTGLQGIGAVVDAFKSDERLKNKVNLTARDHCDRIGQILDNRPCKKRNYSILKIEKVTK